MKSEHLFAHEQNKLNYQSEADEFLDSPVDDQSIASADHLVKNLQAAKRWDLLAPVAKKLIDLQWRAETAAAYLQALRSLELHAEGLEWLATVHEKPISVELAIQWGALLCESGDFREALALLRPLTTPIESAPDDLLNLRGWAHQNLEGTENATEGAAVYKCALDKNARQHLQNPTLLRGAKIHAEEEPGTRDVNRVKSLWYRKGFANALSRISGQRSNAEQHWRIVVEEAEQEMGRSPGDFYLLRTFGWCAYRLGEFERAIAAYKQALDSGIARHSLQFDHALVLFSMGSSHTALHQYHKAVCDAQDLKAVRRTCILRVALTDFDQSLSELRNKSGAQQAMAITRDLTEALNNALDAFPLSLTKHKQHIQEDVSKLIDDLHGKEASDIIGEDRQIKSAPVIAWDFAAIVGFLIPEHMPCGLFLPMIKYRDETYRISATDKEPTLSSRQSSSMDHMVTIPPIKTVSAATRVLFLSAECVSLLNQLSIQTAALRSADCVISPPPAPGIACPVNLEQGETILDNLASEILQKIVDSVKVSDQTNVLAMLAPDWAKIAFCAAQSEPAIYQAALCCAAFAAQPPDFHRVRPDLRSGSMPNETQIAALVSGFRKLIHLVPRKPMIEWSHEEISAVASAVIARATHVSRIENPGTQLREAIWAAAEFDLLIRDDERSIAIRDRLERKILKLATSYISDETETIAFSRDPGLFCALRFDLSKPAIDTFAFFKSRARLKSPIVANHPVRAIAVAREL
jgi:tetratricopeptide (TPR) repeat protein